jgi:hypothetical protein
MSIQIHQSEAGRIVNIRSGRGSLTQHNDPHCLYIKSLRTFIGRFREISLLTIEGLQF